MAIERQHNKYILMCDTCSEWLIFDTFDEAAEYKEDFGWSSKKINGEWENYCPKCLVEE